jgi:hypothetical protein
MECTLETTTMQVEGIDLVQTVGFPIAMCLLMYLDMRKKLDKVISLLEKAC